MEAIVLCEQLCLSRTRLIRRLEELRDQVPGFAFRFASAAEAVSLSRTLRIQILPATILAGQVVYGVPETASLLALMPTSDAPKRV
ncbi:MAG: hypothetical protein CVV27_20525 [Candidatus Melainabacteria bacterium HGW-Melainabacteria-1]|nr:MAG: hypothetical protein CVV27_20525 [Candidatus Melainabacteria bacterium HGW-Melainabacteria-1]